MKLIRFIQVILGLLLFLSCNSPKLELQQTKEETIRFIGEPDSIVKKQSIPDNYTNKLIELEVYYYGKDTMITFANQKVQSIKIN